MIHEALVAQRVHAEGGPVSTDTKAAQLLFGLRDHQIVEGCGAAGMRWAGTGHAMIAGNVFDRPSGTQGEASQTDSLHNG